MVVCCSSDTKLRFPIDRAYRQECGAELVTGVYKSAVYRYRYHDNYLQSIYQLKVSDGFEKGETLEAGILEAEGWRCSARPRENILADKASKRY